MGRTRPTDSSIPQARPFVTWYFVRWRTFWVGRGARKRPGALPAGLEACGGGFWPSCVAKKDAAALEVPAIRTVPKTNSKPSAAGSSWKGGARERREKSGAPVRERPVLSGADFAPTWSECNYRTSKKASHIKGFQVVSKRFYQLHIVEAYSNIS